MDTLLQQLATYRKHLLLVLAAALIALIINTLRPQEKPCLTQAIPTPQPNPSVALTKGHEAVPIVSLEENLLKNISINDLISITLLETGKSFEKLKVLAKNPGSIVVQTPTAQATELAKAQHGKNLCAFA